MGFRRWITVSSLLCPAEQSSRRLGFIDLINVWSGKSISISDRTCIVKMDFFRLMLTNPNERIETICIEGEKLNQTMYTTNSWFGFGRLILSRKTRHNLSGGSLAVCSFQFRSLARRWWSNNSLSSLLFSEIKHSSRVQSLRYKIIIVSDLLDSPWTSFLIILFC